MIYVKPRIEIQNNFDNVGCRRFGLVQVVRGSLRFQNQEDYDDFRRVLEALRQKYLFTESTEATMGLIAHEATNLLRSFGIEGIIARTSFARDHSSLNITWTQES
jgi:hypothetical protein